MVPVAPDLAWPQVAAARTCLADALDALGAEDWDRPTPCAEWTVRDVVRHVLAMAEVPPTRAMWTYLRSGADLDRTNARLADAVGTGRTDTALAAALRAGASARHRPPGLRPVGVLAEVVVHSVDVAAATGTEVAVADAAWSWTLEYLATRVPGNTRFHVRRAGRIPVLDGARRADGLHLVATDVGWSHGDPATPPVTGPAAALVGALAGRAGGLDRLTGQGTAALAATWAD